MEPQRKKATADSFGTFLETVQQRSAQPDQPGGGAAAVITVLQAHGPQQLSELQLKTGLSFSDFAPAVNVLRESGIVTVTGEPGREVVALSERRT